MRPIFPSARLAAIAFTAWLGVAQLSAQVGDVRSDPGYFPTLQDSLTLSGPWGADPDYPRSSGGVLNGPDLTTIGATSDFWAYETQPTPLNWLQRNLQPIDYVLRPFTRGQGFNFFQNTTGFSSVDVSGNFPFLTRSYDKSRSHLAYLTRAYPGISKWSPLFFDVMNISALAAYGHGSRQFDVGDGFIAGVSPTIRGGFRLTDRTAFLVDMRLYFIYDEDTGADGGFGFYMTSGQPAAFATILHQFEIGQWDISLFDFVGAVSGWDLFRNQTYDGAFAQTVGASIGIHEFDYSRGDWFDSKRAWLYNQAGIRAAVFPTRYSRFQAGMTRRDSWSFDGFDHTKGSEIWQAALTYDDNGWPIAPSLTWSSFSQDLSFYQHMAMLTATMPLDFTKGWLLLRNLTFSGGIGYTFGENGDQLLWNLSANWKVTSRLLARLHYAQGYFSPDVGSDWLGTNLGGSLVWSPSKRARLGYHVGWAKTDNEDTRFFGEGLFATYDLGNYSQIYGSIGHQQVSQIFDQTTILYQIELRSRLATRLQGSLGYRNVDVSNNGTVADGDWGTFYLQLVRTF
ncbi:MAG: hypothetical protein KDK99_15070 [Verrucomicrobiales bacterium]|nr:hypothetical protein [Verrucomicrobiales bacterium]